MHLPRILNPFERFLASVAVLLILTSSSLLLVHQLRDSRATIPAIGGSYTEGLIGSPQLINPLYAMTSDVDTDLARLIYSGLMRYDAEDGLVPDLADWFEISEDGLEYTFGIRENATWHDGRPVIASDVIYTITSIQNSQYRSPLGVSFSGVQVEQIDERTVKLILEEPFGPFLSLLTVGILPSHLWSNVSPLNAVLTELNIKPVGSGPYRFEKLEKDTNGTVRTYTLMRNPDFYFEGPYIEELTFKFYHDSFSAAEGLRNKNVEGVSYLPHEQIVELANDSDVRVLLPTLPQYTSVFFHQENSDILDDSDVREALAIAVDKERLVEEVFSGYASAIESFVLPGMDGYTSDYRPYGFDRERAIEILEDDGWDLEDGAEVRSKGDETLSIELAALNAPDLAATAEALKAQWAEIGVQVDLRLVDNAEFEDVLLGERDYEMILSGELYGIDADPYPFWHSSQTSAPGLNLANFSSRTADEYIETARSTTNPEVRAEAFQNLQELISDDVAALFLYQPMYAYPTSSRVQNQSIEHIVTPADRFSRIWEWYVKTRSVYRQP